MVSRFKCYQSDQTLWSCPSVSSTCIPNFIRGKQNADVPILSFHFHLWGGIHLQDKTFPCHFSGSPKAHFREERQGKFLVGSHQKWPLRFCLFQFLRHYYYRFMDFSIFEMVHFIAINIPFAAHVVPSWVMRTSLSLLPSPLDMTPVDCDKFLAF